MADRIIGKGVIFLEVEFHNLLTYKTIETAAAFFVRDEDELILLLNLSPIMHIQPPSQTKEASFITACLLVKTDKAPITMPLQKLNAAFPFFISSSLLCSPPSLVSFSTAPTALLHMTTQSLSFPLPRPS